MRDAHASVHLVAATVGFTSLALLWLTVLWGITLRAGWGLTRVRHQTLYGTHSTLTMVGLTLGLVHALAQLAVPGGPVGWIDEWLPFTNGRDPFGVGIAVIALELMVAIAISVLLQRRLGYHRWQRMHLLGYAAFALLCGHTLLSGSDVGPLWIRVTVGAMLASAALLRLVTAPAAARWPRAYAQRISERLRGRQVLVSVDPSRCVRFGFCEHEAPTVFRLRGDGRLSYRTVVPPDDVEAVIQASNVCPARAIMLSRSAGTVIMPSQWATPTGEHRVATAQWAGTTGEHRVATAQWAGTTGEHRAVPDTGDGRSQR